MPVTAEGHDRAYLQSRIREEIDRARRYGHPFSLLVLEAHPANDGIPIRRKVDHAIERVCAGLRPSDIVARAFDDTVVILLVETDAAGARDALFRLRNRLFQVGKLSWNISALTFPRDGDAIEVLPAFTAA